MKRRIISTTTKIILSIFIATLILTFLLYLSLRSGIEMPRLTIAGIHIERLYLKLDKKLILHIQKLHLPSQKKRPLHLLPAQITHINKLNSLFQEITIEQLQLPKEHLRLSYNHNRFKIEGKDFWLKAKLHYNRAKKRLEVAIDTLRSRQFGLKAHGLLRIYKNDRIFANLSCDMEGLRFVARAVLRKKRLSFRIASEPFDNQALKKSLAHLPLHPLIKAWSSEKVVAKRYQILSLKADDLELEHIDPSKIEGEAVAQDVTIHFQKGVDPIKAKSVTIRYKNDTLSFTLQEPRYHTKDLRGSTVAIHDLTKPTSSITIDLQTTAPFDEDIQKILASYGIDLPLLQHKGSVQATLRIQFWFRSHALTLDGTFAVSEGAFDLGGIDLVASNAIITLKDRRLSIKKGTLQIPPYLRSDLHGTLDLQKGTGKFVLKKATLTVSLDGSDPILSIPPTTTTLLVDIRKKVAMIPRYNFTYDFKTNKITIKHAQDLRNYAPLIKQIDPKDLLIEIDVGKKLFTAYLHLLRTPFSRQKPIDRLTITLNLPKHTIMLGDFATINFAKNLKVSLHDVTLDIQKLRTYLRSFQKGKSHKKILAQLQNIWLRYGKHALWIERGEVTKKEQLIFKAKLRRGQVTLQKAKELSIKATNLTASTLNDLIGKRIFTKGSYTIVAGGNENELKGKVTIKEGYLKDLKLLNNFFAFINTIPSLVALKNPGFDSTGLLVKKGTITFIYTKDKLLLPTIALRSISTDIVGSGMIDLAKKRIKMRLDLQTLKGVATLVSKIPVAGYILLGKDGTIATTVEVYGDLEDPQFRSLLPSQTLKLPFTIIKRTFELPFKLFE